MKTIVIINGKPRSGKDTLVDMCVEEAMVKGISVRKISSVDKVKEAATLLGWDGEKDEVGRQFLSDLKDMSTKLYDGPMRYMANFVSSSDTDIAFLMIREPEEIDKFVREFPRTITMKVERDMAETFQNHADANVDNYEYDIVVTNNDTLEALNRQAKGLVRTLKMFQSWPDIKKYNGMKPETYMAS